MRRVLVTGATGFIGFRLVERLMAQGVHVFAFGGQNSALEAARCQALEAIGITIVIGSLNDVATLQDLAGKCDTLIHLAAAQHESHLPDDRFVEVNVEGTRNVVEAAKSVGGVRLVYGSTIGVYGSSADTRLDEGSPTGPDNIYGVTKLAGEAVVRESADDIPWTIVRISETYGPGDNRLLKLFRLVDRGVVPLVGDGMNTHQPVYVDDLTNGLVRAASTDLAIGETVLLAGSELLTTRDIIYGIADALGRAPRLIRLPEKPLRTAVSLAEACMRPFGLRPPLTQRRLDFFTKSFAFSIDKARYLLMYSPGTGFLEGAAKTSAWYRTHDYI